MNSLHMSMCRDIMEAPKAHLGVISNVDVTIDNIIGQADTMVWDFDLKSLWLTKSRWSMMVRQYLDQADVATWMNQCVNRIGRRDRGQAVLRTRVVKPRGGAATGHTNMETRRWGSCMLSVSYRAKPQPTITLHSRTSYLGYLSALDFTIAEVLARYLAKQLKFSLEDFRFVWMAESVQWHAFKSLPFALTNTDDEVRKLYRRVLLKKLDTLEPWEQELAKSPAMLISKRWLNMVRREDMEGLTLGETTYNTYRRVRRRWHTEVLGYEKAKTFEGWSFDREGNQKEFFKAYNPLPSCWTSTLDLSPIRFKLGDQVWKGYDELRDNDLNEADDLCLLCGWDEDGETKD